MTASDRAAHPRLAAAIATAIVALLALAIVVLPAEIVFFAKNGRWYASARAAQSEPQADDFHLYRHPFPIGKPPGRIRVLAVGGSTTYGFGLPAAGAWPAQLQRLLDADRPGRFEIVNVGYLGGHLEAFIEDFARASRRYVPREKWLEGDRPSEAERAQWGWRDLHPDLVIVVPIVNDTAPDYTFMRAHGDTTRWSVRLADTLQSTPVLRSLAISHYARILLLRAPASDAAFSRQAAHERIRQTYRANLERFMRLWGPDARVLVLGFPWLFNADDGGEAVRAAMTLWNVSDRKELDDELSYFPSLEMLEVGVRAEVAKDLASPRVAAAEVSRETKALPFRERVRLYLDPVHMTAEGTAALAAQVERLLLAATEARP